MNNPHISEMTLPSLRDAADLIRNYGHGNDKVLAHIHPTEAEHLSKKYGFSGYNPHTGLPQFGRWVSRKITKHTNKWLPSVASGLGHMMLPGLGGLIGGTLGGALTSNRDEYGNKSIMSNALRGLGTGALVSGGLHLAGNLIPGMGSMSIPALQGLPIIGGGAGAEQAQEVGQNGETVNVPKKSGMFGMDTLLNLGLPALAILGTMKRKVKRPEERPHELPSEYRDKTRLRKLKPIDRKRRELPIDWSAEKHGEHQWYENDQPFPFEEDESYETGGRIQGPHGGIDDTRKAHVSDGEYVLNSTTCSLIGDGNTENGFHKIEKMEEDLRRYKGLHPKQRIYRKTPPLNKLMGIRR